MPRLVTSESLHSELARFLANEEGLTHDGDVGALLGQAALALEVPLAVAPFPPRLGDDEQDEPVRYFAPRRGWSAPEGLAWPIHMGGGDAPPEHAGR